MQKGFIYMLSPFVCVGITVEKFFIVIKIHQGSLCSRHFDRSYMWRSGSTTKSLVLCQILLCSGHEVDVIFNFVSNRKSSNQ
mmetsp:Transcript_4982/g.10472  ORF Transcript_4982/g.10472 Transcript_4982/m.10472 type:complete len:82 (+) Transcript_4982:1035-1280(+)